MGCATPWQLESGNIREAAEGARKFGCEAPSCIGALLPRCYCCFVTFRRRVLAGRSRSLRSGIASSLSSISWSMRRQEVPALCFCGRELHGGFPILMGYIFLSHESKETSLKLLVWNNLSRWGRVANGVGSREERHSVELSF